MATQKRYRPVVHQEGKTWTSPILYEKLGQAVEEIRQIRRGNRGKIAAGATLQVETLNLATGATIRTYQLGRV